MFGVDFGPIWLDSLSCIGNETNLLQCQRTGTSNSIGNSLCTHLQDVGVRCQRKASTSVYCIHACMHIINLHFNVFAGYPSSVTVEGRDTALNVSWRMPIEHSSSIIEYRYTVRVT